MAERRTGVCENCGKNFSYTLYPSRKSLIRFCSKPCHYAWKKKNLTGAKAANWRGGPIVKKCGYCGDRFKINKAQSSRSKYCSKVCYWSHKKETTRGLRNNNWCGGTTSLATRFRLSEAYKVWRIEIFRRDRFSCNNCGKSGGELHLHHIKPLSKLFHEVKSLYPLFDTFTASIFYDPIWDKKNVVTLCVECHKKTESYGKAVGARYG